MEVVPFGNLHVELTGNNERWETTQREGDFEGEQRVARRVVELGLAEAKRGLELELRRRIEDSMKEQDALVSALDSARRRRPLSDRMQSVIDTILHVIRYRIRNRQSNDENSLATRSTSDQTETASLGKECEVRVLMGVFTNSVSHYVDIDNRVIVLTGKTPCPPRLTKEIRLQLPRKADISRLVATYEAGVYEIIAPFGTVESSSTTTALDVPVVESDKKQQQRQPSQADSHMTGGLQTPEKDPALRTTTDFPVPLNNVNSSNDTGSKNAPVAAPSSTTTSATQSKIRDKEGANKQSNNVTFDLRSDDYNSSVLRASSSSSSRKSTSKRDKTGPNRHLVSDDEGFESVTG